MRNAKKKDFIGKTIKNIKFRADNTWTITFDDGSLIEIWAEAEGSLPYLYVDDHEKTKKSA